MMVGVGYAATESGGTRGNGDVPNARPHSHCMMVSVGYAAMES